MRTAAAVLLGALLFAGCGGGDEESSAAEPTDRSSSELVAQTSPPAPLPPVYVESETCRAKMAPLVDTMLANDTKNLAYATFHARFEELDRKTDGALLACSNAVAKPTTRVIYEYSLANLAWGFCDQEKCATELIAKHIRVGNDLARKVSFALEATA